MNTPSLDQLLHQIANPATLAWNEETYDLALAAGLGAAERAVFVRRLIAATRDGDARAILTLGHLQVVDALALLQALGTSQTALAPTARRALVLLGRGAEVVDLVAADATHGAAKMLRVAAVLDLSRIGGPRAIAALQQALADEDYTVRLLAWDGLIEAFGLLPLLRNPDGARELSTHIELLRVLLGSDLAAFVRMGVAEMRALVDQLSAGASPASLGIAWRANPAPEVFTQLRLALVDPDAAFPVAELAALTGDARRLAETMIALRLEDQDPRVPEALVRLDAAWTAPALEAVAASPATPAALRGPLARAVSALRSS